MLGICVNAENRFRPQEVCGDFHYSLHSPSAPPRLRPRIPSFRITPTHYLAAVPLLLVLLGVLSWPSPRTRCKLFLKALPVAWLELSLSGCDVLSARVLEAPPALCLRPRKLKLILLPALALLSVPFSFFLLRTATTGGGSIERGGHSPSRFQPVTQERTTSLRLTGHDGVADCTTILS